MAAKKKRGRPKGSKNKTTTTKRASSGISKGHRKKRSKKSVTAIAVPKASLSNELSLLQSINHKVNRIDQTVNAGFHLARKAKHAQRRQAFSHAFEEGEREGITAE
jgi:hypothetical protein